jgi:hypothetical protein
VLDVEFPSCLSYSLFAPRLDLEDKPENYFTMTYTLVDDAGATTLTVIQEGPRPGARDEDEDEDEDEENPVLATLEALAESVGK